MVLLFKKPVASSFFLDAYTKINEPNKYHHQFHQALSRPAEGERKHRSASDLVQTNLGEKS